MPQSYRQNRGNKSESYSEAFLSDFQLNNMLMVYIFPDLYNLKTYNFCSDLELVSDYLIPFIKNIDKSLVKEFSNIDNFSPRVICERVLIILRIYK